MQRVLSGVRPSGKLHIGNYLGAIKQWVEMQEKYDCYFMIADLHAITSPFDPKTFQKDTLELLALYLAAGLDPQKCILFRQSDLPEHVELFWLLNTLVSIAELQRMTQFKEKSQNEGQVVSAGLLNYPVLQAADILLYQADLVPVGEDQVQHVELTRNLARKFNSKYGKVFTEPKPLLTEEKRIMSLTEPTRKMSKTDPEDSFIALTDSPEVIKEKIGKAVTDVGNEKEISAGSRNLLGLMEAFGERDEGEKWRKQREAGTIKYSQFKPALAEAIIKTLSPLQKRYQSLISQSSNLLIILNEGNQRAQKVASQTLEQAKKAVGMA
jgi:tryptophanyl-tRNA synthetase